MDTVDEVLRPHPGPHVRILWPPRGLGSYSLYTRRPHTMSAYLIHVTLALDNYRLPWTHLTRLWKVQKQLPQGFLSAEDRSNQG